MSTDAARLGPVEQPDEFQLEQMHTRVERDGQPLNIFATLAHNPYLLRQVNRLGGQFLFRGTLDPREREILILRSAYRSGCEYEFGQHRLIGADAGLTATEIAALAAAAEQPWSQRERLLIDTVDQLADDDRVNATTWTGLATHWTPTQLVELLLVPGYYRMLAGFLNSAQVQRDTGVPGWPEAEAEAE